MNILLVILGGLIGGALRGLIGIAKGLVTKEEEKINYKYFFVSLAVSGLVGLVAALMLPVDFKFALLAGYAGSDFLETLYKMKLQGKLEDDLVDKLSGTEKEEKE